MEHKKNIPQNLWKFIWLPFTTEVYSFYIIKININDNHLTAEEHTRKQWVTTSDLWRMTAWSAFSRAVKTDWTARPGCNIKRQLSRAIWIGGLKARKTGNETRNAWNENWNVNTAEESHATASTQNAEDSEPKHSAANVVGSANVTLVAANNVTATASTSGSSSASKSNAGTGTHRKCKAKEKNSTSGPKRKYSFDYLKQGFFWLVRCSKSPLCLVLWDISQRVYEVSSSETTLWEQA